MRLCPFFPLLLILLLNSQCPLQTCSAEINPPARELINLESLPGFLKWPFRRVRKPPLRVYEPKWPTHPDLKSEWKGQRKGIIETLRELLTSALCDHLVADKGVVSCVQKGFCRYVLPKGLCGDKRTICHYHLPGSNRTIVLTYLESTCANVCFSYQYYPNRNQSTCSIWIPPSA